MERRRATPIRMYRTVMRTIGRTNSRNVETCQYVTDASTGQTDIETSCVNVDSNNNNLLTIVQPSGYIIAGRSKRAMCDSAYTIYQELLADLMSLGCLSTSSPAHTRTITCTDRLDCAATYSSSLNSLLTLDIIL